MVTERVAYVVYCRVLRRIAAHKKVYGLRYNATAAIAATRRFGFLDDVVYSTFVRIRLVSVLLLFLPLVLCRIIT